MTGTVLAGAAWECSGATARELGSGRGRVIRFGCKEESEAA